MHVISLMQTILNMSYTGSIVIIIVLLVRLLLKKSPKIYSYLLWSIVLFRLLCPVTVTSSFSLFGLAGHSAPAYMIGPAQTAATDLTNAASAKEPSVIYEKQDFAGQTTGDNEKTDLPMKNVIWMTAAGFWLLGIYLICCYGAYSLWKTKKMLRGAKRIEKNVYEIYRDVSPFVIGIFHPRICLPCGLDDTEREYILLHEKTHIRRGDFMVKIIAFWALTIHWFNPFVWIAFSLLEKDMELSCDEAVMRHMHTDIRAAYAASLVKLSAVQKRAVGAPPAFGVGRIKDRIKNVMQYKKPKLHAVVLSVFSITVCCIALGSNPKDRKTLALEEQINFGQAKTTADLTEIKKTSALEEQINSGQTKTAADLTEIKESLAKWAAAFCNRDGDTITKMSGKEVRESLIERGLLDLSGGVNSFGMSSPWMWNENDYQIVSYDEKEAVILYYAWTSDPHVTVWYETLAYHKADNIYHIDLETLTYFDYICTGEEFLKAYPFGLPDTRMDYLANEAGEVLNNNALLSSSNLYRGLFNPDTAAVMLLNLLNNPNKVDVLAGPASEDGTVPVQVTFMEDGSVFTVTMVRPYENGIWIPQSFRPYAGADVGIY